MTCAARVTLRSCSVINQPSSKQLTVAFFHHKKSSESLLDVYQQNLYKLATRILKTSIINQKINIFFFKVNYSKFIHNLCFIVVSERNMVAGSCWLEPLSLSEDDVLTFNQ